ncbi:unnamed protein product [Trichogramma brassicae]|uniref:Uncharacterized protein n=1 Tax=Trichogramma brassicae TaxID=86971 RepID=A0A6H5J598_9HYME|nr:unnamed protein product [Trichogramma brassicae]
MYYDVNTLSGWAMVQYLPYGGFEWADMPKIKLTLPRRFPSTETFLEVDIGVSWNHDTTRTRVSTMSRFRARLPTGLKTSGKLLTTPEGQT